MAESSLLLSERNGDDEEEGSSQLTQLVLSGWGTARPFDLPKSTELHSIESLCHYRAHSNYSPQNRGNCSPNQASRQWEESEWATVSMSGSPAISPRVTGAKKGPCGHI